MARETASANEHEPRATNCVNGRRRIAGDETWDARREESILLVVPMSIVVSMRVARELRADSRRPDSLSVARARARDGCGSGARGRRKSLPKNTKTKQGKPGKAEDKKMKKICAENSLICKQEVEEIER